MSDAMLFVPGGDERKLAKVGTMEADAYILDLEDAVAVGAKQAARRLVRRTLDTAGTDIPLWVRVNPAGTGRTADDVAAVATPRLAGVVLPKVESAGDVETLDRLLSEAGSDAVVIGIVETVAGLENVRAITAASSRLRALAFGAGDFSLDVGLDWPLAGPNPLLTHARVELVLASRAAGLEQPHDGAYPRHRDTEGLRAEAEHARSLGFGTKHAIHPAQVPVIRAVFRPSDEQVARARRICAEFEAAEANGDAAISVDGMLVDYPVWRRARKVLEAAGERA